MEQLRYKTVEPEYAVAFRSIRAGKNFFAMVIALCIVAQLAGFVLVRFAGVTDAPAAASSGPASRPASRPTVEINAAAVQRAATWRNVIGLALPQRAATWRNVIGWALPATKFAAPAACLLMLFVLTLALNLSLLERVGGVAGFISAFFWALILLAMLIPWQHAPWTSYAKGALFNLGDLEVATWGLAAGSATALDQIVYFVRFIGYPVLALLVWLVVQVKFARGYRRVNFTPGVSEPGASSPPSDASADSPGPVEPQE